jgi:hypothetical protein
MAMPVLALLALAVAGLGLTGTIVAMVKADIRASTAEPSSSGSLLVPAPALADGLPARQQPVTNTGMRKLIAEFSRRFAAVAGGASGQPDALYREPGTIDLATNEPGWVMYQGRNSATNLGAPGVTTRRVAAGLAGSSGPGSSWPVAQVGVGGSARCSIAHFAGASVSLCVWATDDTIGALMSPTADTRANELARLMAAMRIDLQPS